MGYIIFTISWMVIITLWSAAVSYVGFKNNTIGGNWFYLSLCMSFFPAWAIVSRYSRNLAFDGIVMDVLIVLGTAITLYLCGTWEGLRTSQSVAIVMIVAGFILYNLRL